MQCTYMQQHCIDGARSANSRTTGATFFPESIIITIIITTTNNSKTSRKYRWRCEWGTVAGSICTGAGNVPSMTPQAKAVPVSLGGSPWNMHVCDVCTALVCANREGCFCESCQILKSATVVTLPREKYGAHKRNRFSTL